MLVLLFNVSALIVPVLLFGDTGAMLAFKQPVNNKHDKIKYIGFIVEFFG